MDKVVQMNYDCREPKMGDGLVPLFTAAAVFWAVVAAIGVFIFG